MLRVQRLHFGYDDFSIPGGRASAHAPQAVVNLDTPHGITGVGRCKNVGADGQILQLLPSSCPHGVLLLSNGSKQLTQLLLWDSRCQPPSFPPVAPAPCGIALLMLRTNVGQQRARVPCGFKVWIVCKQVRDLLLGDQVFLNACRLGTPVDYKRADGISCTRSVFLATPALLVLLSGGQLILAVAKISHKPSLTCIERLHGQFQNLVLRFCKAFELPDGLGKSTACSASLFFFLQRLRLALAVVSL